MKKALFLFFLMGFCFITADAQVFKNQKKRAAERAQNRAKYKAQRKADQKVDDAVDDAFDSIGSLFKKKKKKKVEEGDNNTEPTDYSDENDASSDEDGSADFMNMIMGGKNPSDLGLPNNYHFDTYLKGSITTINKKGKEDKMPMNYMFKEKEEYFGYEIESQAIGIIDAKRLKIISIVVGQNMATVMAMEDVAELGEELAENEEENIGQADVKITKTGKTKTIAGYLCHQYLMESEDMTGEMWQAKDFEGTSFSNMGKSMSQLTKNNKSFKLSEAYSDLNQSGFVFEAIYIQKKSSEKTIFLIESVEKKSQDIDLTSYKIMDLGGFMKGKN